MNRRGRVGLENILLRWVQRHQSMTALFRAPDTDRSRRLGQSKEAGVVHAHLQDFPLPEQTPAEARAIAPTTPPPSIIARKVASPSVPVTVPRKSKSPEALPPPKTTSHADSDWQRLETIFRKHQEQSQSQTDLPSDITPPTIEPVGSDALQPINQKEPTEESTKTTVLRQNPPPVNAPPTAPPAAQPVQRQIENAHNQSQPAVTRVMRKDQPQDSLAAHVEPAPKADFSEAPLETSVEEELHNVTEQEPSPDSLPQQPMPLEYVWNVQRIEAPEIPINETNTAPASNTVTHREVVHSQEISKPEEQKLDIGPNVFQEELQTEIGDLQQGQATDSNTPLEAQAPVEILSPSRPRPQAKVLPSNAPIQRQPESSPTTDEIPEAHLVDTAIGPLPSDLWRLLGQEPPASAPKTELPVQRSTSLNPEETSRYPKMSSAQPKPTPEEKPTTTTTMPAVIQRQMLMNDDLMPPALAEHGETSQEDETNRAEPDMDDLARRVYAEIRRRLSAEWERFR